MTADLTQYSTCRGETKPKTHCPICGHDFMVEPSEIRAINTCHSRHKSDGQSFTPEELITGDDDYAWVL